MSRQRGLNWKSSIIVFETSTKSVEDTQKKPRSLFSTLELVEHEREKRSARLRLSAFEIVVALFFDDLVSRFELVVDVDAEFELSEADSLSLSSDEGIMKGFKSINSTSLSLRCKDKRWVSGANLAILTRASPMLCHY